MTQTNKKPINEVISENMMGYSAYVLLNRAIPDLRDGFKPSYRRILETMRRIGATSFMKSATISGEVMKIHPHGDTYDTMVGMGQPYAHQAPFVIGKGNFGEYTSTLSHGASRYTGAKLSQLGTELMKNYGKNVVDFVDNYDATLKVPEVLPVPYPVILTMNQSGTGVGMSSSMISFNIKELHEAMEKYILTNEKTLLVPDFATGGFIDNNEDSLRQINETGQGSVMLRGKYEVVGNEIIIYELPYQVKREVFISSVKKLYKDKKLEEIKSITDGTGIKGQKITIEVKRGNDPQNVVNKLLKMTKLQSSISVQQRVLHNNLPVVMGVWEIIDEWLKFRVECITRGLTFDLNSYDEELEYLTGLQRLLDNGNVEKVIDIIRKTEDETQAKELISKELVVSDETCEKIYNISLRQLNTAYIEKKCAKIETIQNNRTKIINALSNENIILKMIIKDLKRISEIYGVDRMTQIDTFGKIMVKKSTKEVEQEKYVANLFISENGWITKFKDHDHEPSHAPGDKHYKQFTCDNNGKLLLFKENGEMYFLYVNDIPLSKNGDLGNHIDRLIDGVKIKNITKDFIGVTISPESNDNAILFAYESGRLNLVSGESYITKSKRKKLSNSIPSKHKEHGELLMIENINLKEQESIVFKAIQKGKEKEINIPISDINIQNSRSGNGRLF